jgi:hypothetical protein
MGWHGRIGAGRRCRRRGSRASSRSSLGDRDDASRQRRTRQWGLFGDQKLDLTPGGMPIAHPDFETLQQ